MVPLGRAALSLSAVEVSVERGVGLLPALRGLCVCYLFMQLLNMRVLFVRLCASTEDIALNMAGMGSILMVLQIQLGTQNLNEILKSVMSSRQEDPGCRSV